MKRICSLFFLFSCLFAHAQEPPPNMGFVRFVNLVDAGTGNTMLKINGKSPWENGYRLGQKTGALPLGPGRQKFVVEREGCIAC